MSENAPGQNNHGNAFVFIFDIVIKVIADVPITFLAIYSATTLP